MPDELKPCPFCGGAVTADKVSRPWQLDDYCVSCPKCYQRFCFERTEDETIKAFNTRPAEDALLARVAVLEAALKDISKCGFESELTHVVNTIIEKALEGKTK